MTEAAENLEIGHQAPSNVSGEEIIDATQNAIMGVAENVSEVIEAAAGKTLPSEVHHEPFYLEIEFWVGLAFVLSVALLAKPLWGYIKKAIDNRIQKVVDDMDEAVALRDDAQNLLADYERKFVNVQQETAVIIGQAQQNLQNIKNIELRKLQVESQNKKKEAERRIATATEKARSEVNASASRLSVQIAAAAIEKYLRNTDKSKLVDEAIAELDKFAKKA